MLHDAIISLLLFSAKAVVLLVILLALLLGILTLVSRSKDKLNGRITIKNLNTKFATLKEELLHTILPKQQFKQFIKTQKKSATLKKEQEKTSSLKNVYVLNFQGDIKASAVLNLREEINAVLQVATLHDEVIVRLDSPGGMVNAYGLAAAQLSRIRQKHIPLTICIDKMAASGGYLMACVADKILAAPFAIIGSIGVVLQLPNFHRWLKDHNIDFEQLTAGNYKRTLTMFGKNTEEGREKSQEQIEEIHALFKNAILAHRPHIDIEKVSTGEHWLGKQALSLNLVDELITSDDYLLTHCNRPQTNVFEINYLNKKKLGERLSAAVSAARAALGF